MRRKFFLIFLVNLIFTYLVLSIICGFVKPKEEKEKDFKLPQQHQEISFKENQEEKVDKEEPFKKHTKSKKEKERPVPESVMSSGEKNLVERPQEVQSPSTVSQEESMRETKGSKEEGFRKGRFAEGGLMSTRAKNIVEYPHEVQSPFTVPPLRNVSSGIEKAQNQGDFPEGYNLGSISHFQPEGVMVQLVADYDEVLEVGGIVGKREIVNAKEEFFCQAGCEEKRIITKEYLLTRGLSAYAFRAGNIYIFLPHWVVQRITSAVEKEKREKKRIVTLYLSDIVGR